MKKTVLILGLAVGLVCSPSAKGQDFLTWFNNVDATGPDGNLIPGTPDTNTVGAIVQLFRNGGIVSDPSWNFGPGDFEDTDGATGDDVVIFVSWVGRGDTGDGGISDAELFSSLGIGLTTSIFVRVWDRPSSDGAGNLPVPIDYSTNAAVVAIYEFIFPEIMTTPGAFYWNGHVQLANADPGLFPGLYEYEIAAIDVDDWTFLAIPEPSTYLMIVLGMGLLGYRRFRSRIAKR